MKLEELDDALKSAVERELHGQEDVLWVGQPRAARYVLGGLMIAPIGLTILVIAWFQWVNLGGGGLSEFRVDAYVKLIGLALACVGALLTFAPVWGIWAAHRTVYVVTPRRAFVRHPDGLPLQEIPVVEMAPPRRWALMGDMVDVYLGQRDPRRPHYNPRTADFAFVGVAEGDELEKVLSGLKGKASSA